MIDDSVTEQARPLSWRAKYRLRLAAGLLRAQGRTFDMPRDQFYEGVAEAIERLSDYERGRLKSAVDWVEAYDPQDELNAAGVRRRGARPAGPGPRGRRCAQHEVPKANAE